MQPLIPDGATLELKPACLSQLRQGDVVLTVANAESDVENETAAKLFLIHRVISVKAEADGIFLVQTRGDESFNPDKAIAATTFNLSGKVTAVNANGQLHNYTATSWRVLNILLGWASFNQSRLMPDQSLTSSQNTKLYIIERKFFSRLFSLFRRHANRFYTKEGQKVSIYGKINRENWLSRARRIIYVANDFYRK